MTSPSSMPLAHTGEPCCTIGRRLVCRTHLAQYPTAALVPRGLCASTMRLYHVMLLRRLHPHHHGSNSNQITTASMPLVVEQNDQGGHDYWPDAGCAATKAAVYGGAEEVIMHIQACAWRQISLPLLFQPSRDVA